MKPGGGKQKGAAFERKMCKALSRWVSFPYHSDRDDLFWRSAMSGGRATLAKKDNTGRKLQEGDISALGGTDEEAKLAAKFLEFVSIECKFLADCKLESFIMDNKGPLRKALDQASENCSYTKAPLVLAKSNRRDVIMLAHPLFFQGFGMPTYVDILCLNISICFWIDFINVTNAKRILRKTWERDMKDAADMVNG